MQNHKREEIKLTDDEIIELQRISQSRKEQVRRVQRANILLKSYAGKSDSEIAREMGLNFKTVFYCRHRCLSMGVNAALNDLPKSGRPPRISIEAVTWILSLACQKPTDYGYAQETWSNRLLVKYIHENYQKEGHLCLSKLSRSTLWEILNKADIKPHKVQYYCVKKDPDFDAKKGEILKVYKDVENTNKKTSRKEHR